MRLVLFCLVGMWVVEMWVVGLRALIRFRRCCQPMLRELPVTRLVLVAGCAVL